MPEKNTIAATTDQIVRRASYGVLEPLRVSLEVIKGPTARENYGSKEHLRILKNMIMLGLSFTLLFTAFMAMANLQSSINSEVC